MKTLVIEDNAETTEFISIAFNVGWPEMSLLTANNGKKGLELFEQESPDVVILDLGLPDMNGYDVLKIIRGFSEVPIIIETVRDLESDIVKGLDLGADDYIVKPFGQMELLARVKAILRRQHHASLLDSVTYGRMRLDSANQLIYGNKSVHLTPTEGRILRLLMSHADRLVRYEDIVETVWGESYQDSTDAIRVYIRRLRTKIGVSTEGPCLIISTPGIGYTLKISH